MQKRISASALAMAVAIGWASPVLAQDSDDALRNELAAMRAEMARMAARIDTLEAELADTETAEAKPADITAPNGGSLVVARSGGEPVAAADTPAVPESTGPRGPAIAFKGAPEITGENGWSFKPRGRLQYDAGFTSVPSSTGRGDGFGSEARRIRIGASGDMPGGFGYKFEVDFAGGDVAVVDAFIAYEANDIEVIAGQLNNFQSLEELTSSLHTTFIERAAFTDAFGFERRVGLAAGFGSDTLLVQAGVFTDNMDDLSNKNWGADGRVVFMPRLGETQLHLGGSLHYTDLEAGMTARYRQRPLVHFTSERFIDTGNLGASSELGAGLESALIAGPFHAAAEGFWQTVNRPGALTDPTFFGGYAEVGMFLTKGDTRGYKAGKFDRTNPTSPVGEGGWGSLQIAARYDYLDLVDAGIVGGKQNGYLLSLIWKPTDWALLMANYGLLEYDEAAVATITGDTSYDVDAFGLRAQIDF